MIMHYDYLVVDGLGIIISALVHYCLVETRDVQLVQLFDSPQARKGQMPSMQAFVDTL